MLLVLYLFLSNGSGKRNGWNSGVTVLSTKLTKSDVIKAIREVGRTPVQRDTFYQPIKVLTDGGNRNDAESAAKKSKVLEGNLATG